MNHLHILKALDVISDCTEVTYDLGHAMGSFYFEHLHEHLIKFIAVTITLCIHIWVNREKIRNTIGNWFVYKYEPEQPKVSIVEPWINPLFNDVDDLMTMSARNLRTFTSINRKCSKYQLTCQFLSVL